MIHVIPPFLVVLLTAIVLDAIIGDPETKYHPIRGIGWLIENGERIWYRPYIPRRLGGILLVAASLLVTVGVTIGILAGLSRLGPVLGMAGAIFVIAICLAFRSLLDAGERIARDLGRNDLAAARLHLSWIVSRDTDRLDESDIVRGTIESLAENLNDAVIAPLFYTILFGAPGIVAYKTVNTLDSMIGYKSERYLKFGWAAARLDDLLNFIPARIAFLLVVAASFLLHYDARAAWKTVLRYSQTGASPNGGIGICAFAGALRLTLGGTNYFDGEPETTPTVPPVGATSRLFSQNDIKRSERLIVASTLIGVILTAALFLFLPILPI
jgi:adenosylcobinamide-phosphate synthase